MQEARQSNVSNPSEWVSKEMSKRNEWAEDFSKPQGLGRALQERLIDVERASPDNWLNDNYWQTVAYHSWRVPLPINSNWWILCAHDQDVPRAVTDSRPATGEVTNWQVRRAAILVWRLLDFKQRLEREELIPDSSRAARWMRPHLLHSVFGVTRIPALPNDRITSHPHPSPGTTITVIVKDQIFILDVLDEKGEIRSKDKLEAALWSIAKDAAAAQMDPHLSIGVLTGDDRDSWTNAREHLISLSSVNRANLSAIEDSLFVLALDDWTRIHSAAHVSSLASELLPVTPDSTSTKNVEADASLELDGHILNSCAGLNGHNRWFDKAISISVESNSRATVLGEHSPCDALIPSIIADYMLAEGIGKPKGPPKIKSEDGPSATTTKDAGDMGHQQARKLTWVSDQQVVEGIDKAEKTIKDLVDDSEGLVLWYDEYGVEWIKKIAKQSPDAYIQMALQLAYQKLHGQGTPTYETASTRLFRRGRTDTIRTYSEDSLKWVEAVINKKHDAKQLYALLSTAIASHNTLTREASTGKGIDRHLLGLRLNLREGESHQLFTDSLFGSSQQWKLSTSGLSQGDRFFGTGFGATEPDGYGINYLAGLNVLKFGIESKRSSKETSTHEFRLALIESLREMRKICEQGQTSSHTGSNLGAKL
ncbi:MAG: hypothetical protein CYPHOPRED_001580 [Cyphobasidiales sp. Tagirdzhanova-0007]|nr:MAG: hypothetical protein CYPHOPRED_001580 [Cyphobasidiales sp. Tagirdzhanova-0007]